MALPWRSTLQPTALDFLRKKEEEKNKINIFDFSNVWNIKNSVGQNKTPVLNFGAPMSGPGITNFSEIQQNIPSQNINTPQTSWFSLIPKANADNSQDLLQQYLQDMNQDDNSKQQLFQALQDWTNPDELISFLQNSWYNWNIKSESSFIDKTQLWYGIDTMKDTYEHIKQIPEWISGLYERAKERYQKAVNVWVEDTNNQWVVWGAISWWVAGWLATLWTVWDAAFTTWLNILEIVAPESVEEVVAWWMQKLAPTLQKLWNKIEEFKNTSPEARQMVDKASLLLEWYTPIKGTQLAKWAIQKWTPIISEWLQKTGEVLTKWWEKILDTSWKIIDNSKKIIPKPTKLSPQETVRRVEAEKLAQEYGIDLPASSVSGPLASKTEQILGEWLFGWNIKQRAEKAVEDFKKVTWKLQAWTKWDTQLWENIAKSFSELEKNRKTIIDDLYKSADELTKEKWGIIKIDASSTEKFVKELIEREKNVFEWLQDNQVINNLTSIAKWVNPKWQTIKTWILWADGKEIVRVVKNEPTLENYRETLKVIWDKANFDSFNPTTTEKNFRNLYYTLKKDIDNSIHSQVPEIKNLLEEANKEFKAFQELKERPFVKSIQKYADLWDYDSITKKIVNPTISTNEVKQIYTTLWKWVQKDIQKKIINDIIEKSKNADWEFTPMWFSKQMKKIWDEKLEVMLDPGQIKLLKDLEKLNTLVQKAGTVARWSQTAPIQQIMGAVKWLAAISTAGTSLALEYALAKYIGSKAGQKLLKGNLPKIEGGQLIKPTSTKTIPNLVDSTKLSKVLKNSILNNWDSWKVNRLNGRQYSIKEAETGFTNKWTKSKKRIVIWLDDSDNLVLIDGTHLLEAYRKLKKEIPKSVIDFSSLKAEEIFKNIK